MNKDEDSLAERHMFHSSTGREGPMEKENEGEKEREEKRRNAFFSTPPGGGEVGGDPHWRQNVTKCQ